MNNQVQKTFLKDRVKLAVLYFGILAVIIGLFSVIVIKTQNQQFERFDRVRSFVGGRRGPNQPGQLLNEYQLSEVEAVIAEIKRENLRNILMLDAVLLAISSYLAYYLSGRTLEPIMTAFQKQKRFVSDASHELKTPLTNMKTEAEVLLRSKKSSLDEYREFTGNIIEDINHLDELVSYLLDTARIEYNAVARNRIEFYVQEAVEHVISRFEKRASDKDITLGFASKLEKGAVTITNDRYVFERLVAIFIDNAIKYNSKGGTVRVELYQQGTDLFVSIKDTGTGIPADHLPRIFDRFYRVSEDRNEKGFGLGLSIAKQLAEELGMDVEVVSEVGKGSEFRVRL